MKNRKTVVIALLLCGLTAACQPPAQKNAETANAERPNILFLFADDWGWPNAGVYGDSIIRTPTFDSLAGAGMLFTNAFCTPSCSPSRASILTGQYPHRLEAGSQLWGTLPKKFPTYTALLEKAGYYTGLYGKGYGPGNVQAGGYAHNPAGKNFKSFAAFLDSLKPGQPFCFWYGAHDPHRPYVKGNGKKHPSVPGSSDNKAVQVPPYLPNTPEVRKDLQDYYFEVERFDRNCGEILALLRKKGLLKNTLVVMSGDNGKPFPRSKANLYEEGTRVPLVVVWDGRIKSGSISETLVSLADLAPTFLAAAGLPAPEAMTAESLLPLLEGRPSAGKDRHLIYLERERHAYVRKGNAGYPSRAVRSSRFLYIRNFEPDRWPAGDPERVASVGSFGDCDASPSKDFILSHRSLRPADSLPTYFALAFGKRPAEELYDLRGDPYQLHNVAADKSYRDSLSYYRHALDQWMRETADPRAKDPHADVFDHYPYFGPEHSAQPKNAGGK
ncbi:sulfatase [Compostibacter hankyongensis]|uniref:Sulfatase n=1 Tax=Compostibacter hankyongensis TaxID=1007089 RepID=A0ABP8G1K6_9BACT